MPRSSSNTTPVNMTLCILCLVYGLPGTSAQYLEIIHHPQPAYYHAAGLAQHFEDWHATLADLDNIFSVLASESANPTVKVQEQVKTDSNHTSHLYLSVLEQHHCKAHSPVQLSAVQVSVLEDLLTVTANTTHGAFTRSYQLPEHALPDKLTAVYTKENVLHITCPTDIPPAFEPLLIDIVVEPDTATEPEPDTATEPEPAPKPAPKHAADPAAPPAATVPPDRRKHRLQKNRRMTSVADESTQRKSSLDAIDVHAYIKALEADLARLKTLL